MNAILVVSHSREAAQGIASVASQMGGKGVMVAACGGAEDGGLGTSASAICAVLEELLEKFDGVLVIPDLGSAVLSAKAAIDMLGDRADRVLIADGPVLEGTLFAAVEASIGAGLEQLAAVVDETRNLKKLQE